MCLMQYRGFNRIAVVFLKYYTIIVLLLVAAIYTLIVILLLLLWYNRILIYTIWNSYKWYNINNGSISFSNSKDINVTYCIMYNI